MDDLGVRLHWKGIAKVRRYWFETSSLNPYYCTVSILTLCRYM